MESIDPHVAHPFVDHEIRWSALVDWDPLVDRHPLVEHVLRQELLDRGVEDPLASGLWIVSSTAELVLSCRSCCCLGKK